MDRGFARWPLSYPSFRLSGTSSLIFLDIFTLCGGYFGGVTPVPIPNTEVKPTRADGTAREAVWESRSPPHFSEEPALVAGFSFFVVPGSPAAPMR